MTKNNGSTEAPAAKAGGGLTDIARLREQKNVGWGIFAGVCAAENWRPGKQVTSAEFDAAVKRFRDAPMDGRD